MNQDTVAHGQPFSGSFSMAKTLVSGQNRLVPVAVTSSVTSGATTCRGDEGGNSGENAVFRRAPYGGIAGK